MTQQANVIDVYKQILADLLFAYEKGPNVSYDHEGNAKTNRLSKGAAGCMLAKVYLFCSDYYYESYIQDLPYPSEGQTIMAPTVKEILHRCMDYLYREIPYEYYQVFANSSATIKRCQEEVIAKPGELKTLLGEYQPTEYIFTINYNSETLSEPNK